MWAQMWARKVVVGAVLVGASTAGPVAGLRLLAGPPGSVPLRNGTVAAARLQRPAPGPVTFTTLPPNLAALDSEAPPAGGGAGAGAGAGSPGTATSDAAAAGQTVDVTVRPGQLEVAPTTQVLRLTPSGRGTLQRFTATVGPVRVVDARGTLAGWVARVAVSVAVRRGPGRRPHRDRGVVVCAQAGTPTMVAGNPADRVVAARPSCTAAGRPVPLVRAAPGGGGGTYEDTATIELFVPQGTPVPALRVTAAITVR